MRFFGALCSCARAVSWTAQTRITSAAGSVACVCLPNYVTMIYNNKLFRWALFVTYTIIQSIMSSEMCSLHLTHPSAHTWSSGQPTVRRSWGFGALLKGLTSVVDNSCQSQDSNPQPWVSSGFKSNTVSIRPRLPKSSCHDCYKVKSCRFMKVKSSQVSSHWISSPSQVKTFSLFSQASHKYLNLRLEQRV